MKMDWQKEAEGNFPVFPSGTLKVRINSVKRVVSTKKSTPGIQWLATVTEPEELAGRMVSATTWTVEGAMWRLAALVEACGLTGMPAVDTDSDLFLEQCKACINRTTYWRNEQRLFEGKPKNDIVDFQPDPDQGIIEFSQGDEVPDWAK